MVRLCAQICLGLLLAAQLVAPGSAQAGVPRSCIHPRADPIRCPIDTRRVGWSVIPLQRQKALEKQRQELERVAPLQDRERNRLLDAIRRSRCGVAC